VGQTFLITYTVNVYVLTQVIAKLSHQYIFDRLSSMHGEQLGRSREDAELEFLKVLLDNGYLYNSN